MKTLLTLLLILAIAFPKKMFSQSVNNIEYTLKIRKGSVVKGKNHNIWTIPTTLTNLSADTLKYFSVRCSWQDFYSVNNEKIAKLSPVCDKNSNTAIVLKLAPKQSKTTEITLLVDQMLDTSFIPIRIGLNVIRANKPISEFNMRDVFIKENVLWSNVITIQN
ncbi:MAG: hypothetical protein ABIN36_16945 [Ferruginibacter sp.]